MSEPAVIFRDRAGCVTVSVTVMCPGCLQHITVAPDEDGTARQSLAWTLGAQYIALYVPPGGSPLRKEDFVPHDCPRTHQHEGDPRTGMCACGGWVPTHRMAP